jgi:hypothetical protein
VGAEALDEGKLIHLLSDLVAIESVNPAYEGGHGEVQLAAYVEAHCRRWVWTSGANPAGPAETTCWPR